MSNLTVRAPLSKPEKSTTRLRTSILGGNLGSQGFPCAGLISALNRKHSAKLTQQGCSDPYERRRCEVFDCPHT